MGVDVVEEHQLVQLEQGLLEGQVRLKDVRASYLQRELSFSDVADLHDKWKNQHEYCVLAYVDGKGYPVARGRFAGGVLYEDFDYWAFKVSKRGNDVYRSRVGKRFHGLYDALNNCESGEFFPKNSRYGSSKFVLVTFTYNTKRCSQHTAWMNQGREYNLALAKIRQKYGKISVLRSWESFENGYPHVHLVIYFHDHEFICKRFVNKKGKIEYLITREDDRFISDAYHSFVKVNGVRTVGGILYVLKYITKKVFLEEKNLTLVKCWLYGNQQYSMSKDFEEVVRKEVKAKPLLDTLMHNSNVDVLPKTICFYVGIKKLGFDNNLVENTSRKIVRLKPPPLNNGEKEELEEKYGNHNQWLIDFEISDCYCDLCGVPMFMDEARKIKEYGLIKMVCNSCMERF